MRTTTIIKYAAMLHEVKDSCKNNQRIIRKDFSRKHKANNNFLSSLIKLGWIEERGNCIYKWKTGDVTIPMAERVAEFMNEETNGKRHKKEPQLKVDLKEPKVQQKPNPKKEVKPVKTETVSWFWGLYTKTVKG